VFSSSHERSHLLASYGMSDLSNGEPCYVLIWEGSIGNIYAFGQGARVTDCFPVMEDPGNKYSFLYALADPAYPTSGRGMFPREYAGKLMALAAYSDGEPCRTEESDFIDSVLKESQISLTTTKEAYSSSCIYNVGVESATFKRVVRHFSDALFARFYRRAQEVCTVGRPLLIGGGCGLNCDWNSRWRDCGLFSNVFVPPCPNDSGSAIGTAIDAQLYYTGNAKIHWDVYAGASFVQDCRPSTSLFSAHSATADRVAIELERGAVLAWVQGRYEIGPRALGNRSILASPFDASMRTRLNGIKQREHFRPIAPVCAEDDVSDYFEWSGPSPHMLYFQRVIAQTLGAVTHVDGTARVQTVSALGNARLFELLKEFKTLTGYSVLCNTSLNFSGRGFINTMGDLIEFVQSRRLTGFVVDKTLFLRRDRGVSPVPHQRSDADALY
jgi:hydroxymethyl cephem carbamoyltransferase